MDRTVPALLGIIPTNNTLHVRTKRTALVYLSIFVFVDRDRLRKAFVQDPACAGHQIFNIRDISL